jgi:hypothetical protein
MTANGLIDFDFDLVQDQIIRDVRGCSRAVLNDQSLQYDQVVLVLERHALAITVNQDTDELLVRLCIVSEATYDVALVDIPELQDCVGKHLGWCWEGRNSQGYWDMFTVSVSGIEPNFCFVGMASSVHLRRVRAISP